MTRTAHRGNFLAAMVTELRSDGDRGVSDLLQTFMDGAGEDLEIALSLNAWADGGSTIALRQLASHFGDVDKDLRYYNQVHAIDAATLRAREAMPATRRTLEGRLFPPVLIGGWQISLQAATAGYQCAPKTDFQVLEDYSEMEAVLLGAFAGPVDPAELGLPGHVLEKFTPLDAEGSVSIGCNLTWDDVDALRLAILKACRNPNAGVPRGNVGWPRREVWHGSSLDAAEDITAHGVRMDASGKGYFGRAFHVADDRDLAVSNYARMHDGTAAAVVRAVVNENARILDLRNAKDWEAWKPLASQVGDPDFDIVARRAGVDGVYDRSIGGLAIFNAEALRIMDMLVLCEPEDPGAPTGP